MGHSDPVYTHLVQAVAKVPEKSPIQFLPYFYEVFSRLLVQDYDPQDKHHICGALAYLAIPGDRIPEEKHGITGLLDDLYVCCYVMEFLLKKHDKSRFTAYWDYSGVTIRGAVRKGMEQTKPLWTNERLKKTILQSVGIYPQRKEADGGPDGEEKPGQKTAKEPAKPGAKYKTTTPQKSNTKPQSTS